jgi:hypothetical protein
MRAWGWPLKHHLAMQQIVGRDVTAIQRFTGDFARSIYAINRFRLEHAFSRLGG